MTTQETAAMLQVRELIDGYVDIWTNPAGAQQPNAAMQAQSIIDALLAGDEQKLKVLL
jgi:hypothetical protein